MNRPPASTLAERVAAHIRESVPAVAPGLLSRFRQAPQQTTFPPKPALPEVLSSELLPTVEQTSRRSRTITLEPGRLQAVGTIDWTGTRNRHTEEFRIIKRNLLQQAFAMGRSQPGANVVMITSALPREGKTFVALNLALGIAIEPSYHVLLIDADTSRRGLTEIIAPGHRRGLLDLLGGNETDLSQVMLQTDIPNLAMLPAGDPRDSAAELLAGPRMHALLEEISVRYSDRIILIDAPPSLFSSDPAALSSSVGQIIMVIEANRTQRDQIERTLEMIKRCPQVSLLLNKIDALSVDSFGLYEPYFVGP